MNEGQTSTGDTTRRNARFPTSVARIDALALCKSFEGIEPAVARRLLEQLLNVIQPEMTESPDRALIDEALALIRAFQPQDALEACTATMLVAAQHAALDAMRRAAHPRQTSGGRRIYMTLGLKAMRTYAQLMDSLNRGRGKGVTQQIIVKHMTLEPGAKAVVGAVSQGRG